MDARAPLGLLLMFLLTRAIHATKHKHGPVMFRSANFRAYPSSALLADVLKSKSAEDSLDCTNFCLETEDCVSYNIQAKPDHSGRYHCELLATDLFHSPDKFQGNGTFHHYSIQTPCMVENPCTNGGTCLPLYETDSYRCKCVKPHIGINCAKRAKNCAEFHKAGDVTNGVYPIDPDGLGQFDVFCDQTTEGGGWTVFQKRIDGSVDFNRGWTDYKQGFGNLSGEFWLGLDKIHRLTNQTNNKLRVELEDFDGNTAYAEYDMFSVSSGADKYKLSCGAYSGTAGDSLVYHHGMAFSTKDNDNDGLNRNWDENCAVAFKGGWWYKSCRRANLNGLYHHGSDGSHSFTKGVDWELWKRSYYSAKRAEMKIRPVSF